MISFKLFKYIYFRYIIYSIVLGFCMGTVIGFTFGFISGFLAGFHIDIDNTIKGILFLLQLICYVLGYFYISKIIFSKVIFKPYKKIKIDTNMKTISNKFILLFSVVMLLYLIPSLGIVKLVDSIISNNIISIILCFIVNTFIGYGLFNVFLGKYITVSEITNETQNKQ